MLNGLNAELNVRLRLNVGQSVFCICQSVSCAPELFLLCTVFKLNSFIKIIKSFGFWPVIVPVAHYVCLVKENNSRNNISHFSRSISQPCPNLSYNFRRMSKRKTIASDTSQEPKKPKTGKASNWSTGLLGSLDDPELFVKSDDLVTVIKDKYPKAKFHYLVIPKLNIPSIKSVVEEHLALLKHMDKVASEIIADQKHADRTFKVGYHAEPSMTRLHMHVISDDMTSDCLKTKKHWNSFTTKFFLESKDVIKNVETNGLVSLLAKDECKKLMDSPLKCHKCKYKPKTMPDLKKHILTHCKM